MSHHYQGSSGAVGYGDYSLMLFYVGAVDLGNHQRHIRLHAESRAVINHHRAGGHGDGSQFPAHSSADRDKSYIYALEGFRSSLLNHILAPADSELLSGRPV